MKHYILAAMMLSLTGCGIQSLTSLVQSTYKTFEGKFIDSQLDKPDNHNGMETNKETIVPEYTGLVNLRAAVDQELVRNPYIEKYLEGIKNKLLSDWTKERKERIQVVVSAKWNYSAFATNNTVVISQGVLIDADSEDEVAFILAHELSHILLEHNSTNEYFAKQSVIVSKAANVAMISASFNDIQSHKVGNRVYVNYQNTEKTQNKIANAYRTGATINRLSRDVISSTMNRTQEDEADLLGIDLLVQAGYSPRVYKIVMERLHSSETFTKEQLAAKKTELQSFITMASNGQKHLQDFNLSTVGYLAANEAATKLVSHLSERHQSPLERSKDLAHYVKREYRKERRRKPKQDNFNKVIKKGKGHQIMQNYWYASEAVRAIEFGDIKKAEQLARKSVSGLTSKDAYTRLAFYQVRKTQNNQSKALKNLQLIKNWDYASIQTFSLAAQAYRTEKKYKDAKAILERGEKTIGTKKPFYPEYIYLYQKMGNKNLALEYFEDCKKSDAENVVSQCYQAIGLPNPSKEKSSESGFFNTLNSMTNIVNI